MFFACALQRLSVSRLEPDVNAFAIHRTGHRPAAQHVHDRIQQRAGLVTGPGREPNRIQPVEEALLAYARDMEQLVSDLAEEVNDQGVAAEHFEEVRPAAV